MKTSYSQLYELTTGREHPKTTELRYSDADVLRDARGFIGAFDFTMQVQVGCPGGCLYCYVPASKRLTPPDMRHVWGFEVRTKRRAAEKLQRHLDAGKLADKTVYWSGVTDPYAAPPWLTRSIWETLNTSADNLRPRRIAVQSRFRVERDVEPIADYCHSTRTSDDGPSVVISLSIGTDRDDVLNSWERATPNFQSRMKTVETLCRAGLFVVVTLSPFGPWKNLSGTLRTLRTFRVPYLTILFFKLKDSCATTPTGFVRYLRNEWPMLLDPAWQADRLEEIRGVFGSDRVLLDQTGFSTLAAPQNVDLGVVETLNPLSQQNRATDEQTS